MDRGVGASGPLTAPLLPLGAAARAASARLGGSSRGARVACRPSRPGPGGRSPRTLLTAGAGRGAGAPGCGAVGGGCGRFSGGGLALREDSQPQPEGPGAPELSRAGSWTREDPEQVGVPPGSAARD